jgi:CheY-like chemotaxis protein
VLLDGKSIFLVEDNLTNLAVIRTVLMNDGATVPFEHWGDTTLKKILSYHAKIDMILLDLMLPGDVSGYDVFDALRSHEKLRDVPIVAVTAADPDIEFPKVRAKGFNGFISKPINRHQLASDLLSIMNGEEIWP